MSGELDLKKLKEEVRGVSLRRMKNHACDDTIVLEDASELESSKSAVGQWLSLIFVSSSAVKMSFKTYYFTADANYFTSRSMDVYIAKLRKYLDKDQSLKIINVHGEGFRLMQE